MSVLGIRLKTGLPMVDEEHKMLETLSRQVEESLVAGAARLLVLERFDRFVRFARAHFAHEECLLETLTHPDHAAHASDHADLSALMDTVRDALSRIASQDNVTASGLKRFFELEDALFSHIARHDMALPLHHAEVDPASAAHGCKAVEIDSFPGFDVN